MSQCDQGDDIAVRREIPAGFDLIDEPGDVGAARPIHPIQHSYAGRENRIAAVTLRSMHSRDVPSAPAFIERSLIAHRVGWGRPDRVALLVWQHGERHEPGNAAGNRGRIVAYQAEIDLPLKPRLNILILLEGVEDRPQLRIRGGKLQRAAPLYVSHVDVVIEIKRPRTASGDLRELKARLRKDQALRGRWHVQRTKNRTQISQTRFVFERDL